MKKLLFSGIKYQLQAVNQERLFSGLCKQFPLYNIKRASHTQTQFFLAYKHEKQFEKQVKNLNLKILSKQYKGPMGALKKFLKHIGVVCGLVFCFGAYLVLSTFVLQIKINGLESLSQNQVLTVLKQNNIKSFVSKKSINTLKVESLINKNFNNISLVSAIVKGNTLVISIKEKISAGDYDDPDALQPLVAKQSGLITKIEHISGTLNVKVGQIVKTGDVLVQPYVADSSGNKRIVKADAKVFARVWHVGREVHNQVQLVTEKTGKVYKHKQISFLNINLTPPLLQVPFASYETETYETFIAKGNILPIVYKHTTYYETISKQITHDFQQVKDQLFEKAKQKALQLLGEYEIISKQYATVTTHFGITTVEYIIETEKQIN